MDDLENAHSARASELIRDFQAKATEILTGSAKAFATALEALSTAHAEFATDLGALGASTEAQIHQRLATTQQKSEELLNYFRGTVPVKEPVVRITAPVGAQAGDGAGTEGGQS